MEALGLLAGGVAHDLNNILSGITGYPELLLMQLEENSRLRKPLEAIHASGQRAAAVVADLLTVARGIASERKTSEINELVNDYLESAEFLRLEADHPGIVWTVRLAEDSGRLSCSPIHIKKSLMNLVVNAAEAIAGAGNIVISTARAEVAGDRALELGVEPGSYVAITVSDSGKGISRDDLDHIFEPFYTRKMMGRSGTGLGLTVVWNTIQDHNGGIAVDSSPRGTTFAMYFPAAAGRVAGESRREDDDSPAGGGERILVVDDEPLQRDLARGMLSQLGYRAETAASGEQALQLLGQARYELVILDMLMEPGWNGRETYERILAHNPDQKALIVSGFSENNEVKRARNLGAGGFLQKPYAMRELARMVRAVLDSPLRN
jgi:CheY-like chemotaxis protein